MCNFHGNNKLNSYSIYTKENEKKTFKRITTKIKLTQKKTIMQEVRLNKKICISYRK